MGDRDRGILDQFRVSPLDVRQSQIAPLDIFVNRLLEILQ
jgi:hypothetical protein